MITLDNRFVPIRSTVCFLIDAVLLFMAVVIGCFISVELGGGPRVIYDSVISCGFLFSSICLVTMYMLDLYDLRVDMSLDEAVFAVLVTISIGGTLWRIFYPIAGASSGVYFISAVLSFIVLMTWRLLFDKFIDKVVRPKSVLILGSGKIVIELEKELDKRKNLGLRLVGYVDDFPDQTLLDKHIVPNMGVLSDVGGLSKKYGISKVIVALTERRKVYPVDTLLSLRTLGINIIEWPEFFEKLSGRIPVTGLPPSFFIFNEGFQKSKVAMALIRWPSVLLSALALILLSPFLICIAVAIKLDSPGPIFYSQERVGQDGKPFQILKFRSMCDGAEVGGNAVWAQKGDNRITKIGRILRRSRIDEIPQLINVLRGDLNIVGPRPERPEFVEKLEKLIPYYSIRHTVKPGVTGWAQVVFDYCGTVEESLNKLEYDLFYIKNMSIRLDLVILVKTVKIVLLGRGAR